MVVIDLFVLSALGWRSAYAMEPLQTICLNGVSHQHAMQDVTSSATLHHPAPRRAIGDWILPAYVSSPAKDMMLFDDSFEQCMLALYTFFLNMFYVA